MHNAQRLSGSVSKNHLQGSHTTMSTTQSEPTDTRTFLGRDPRDGSQLFIVAEGRCWATARASGAWIAASEAVEAEA